MSAPMLIVPNGWTLTSHDNFVTNETVMRLINHKFQKAFEFTVPMDQQLDGTEATLYAKLQQWVWIITGEKPVPNDAWKTPAAKAAIAKATGEPWPKAEWTEMEALIEQQKQMGHAVQRATKGMTAFGKAMQTTQDAETTQAESPLPPGITRRIELE